jgi:uncharacterized membrane protein YedE/YeeE
MFETFGFETLDPRSASLWFGLALGLAFGALAEVTRFCLRRGVAGDPAERRPALAVWLAALGTAILGTQGAVAAGWIDFAGHRFAAPALPWLSAALGGALFGAGMVLARGCAARLTVLSASGNLRALTVIVILALVAHATMRGVLAPVRAALGSLTLPLGEAASLGPIAALALALGVIAGVVFLARRGDGLRIAGGVAIGALVPLAWVGTGFVLQDDFDPIPVEALAFTGPLADALFYGITSTAIAPGFGVLLVLGTLLGAFVATLLAGRFRWEGFTGGPAEMGRYGAGGALMGFGGVLAGGCTVGAGLSGVATGSLAAILTLIAIVAGARLTDRALSPSTSGSAAREARRPAQPAA